MQKKQPNIISIHDTFFNKRQTLFRCGIEGEKQSIERLQKAETPGPRTEDTSVYSAFLNKGGN